MQSITLFGLSSTPTTPTSFFPVSYSSFHAIFEIRCLQGKCPLSFLYKSLLYCQKCQHIITLIFLAIVCLIFIVQISLILTT